MNLLNEQNPLHIFLNKLGDIILSNILFLLCSIPIVTIGPALTALYHCSLRSIKGNNNGTVKTFFRALKENFVQSLLVWLGLLAAGTILFLNLRFLLHTPTGPGKILFYLSGAAAAFLIVLALYIFPVIAAFRNTTGKLLKNALLFAFMHFPTTLFMGVLCILPMYMTYQDLELLPLYAFCWCFFAFGLIAYINSFFLYRIFKPYLEKSDSSQA